VPTSPVRPLADVARDCLRDLGPLLADLQSPPPGPRRDYALAWQALKRSTGQLAHLIGDAAAVQVLTILLEAGRDHREAGFPDLPGARTQWWAWIEEKANLARSELESLGNPPKRRRPRRLRVTNRQCEAVNAVARRKGDWKEVATDLGTSRQNAQKLYKKAEEALGPGAAGRPARKKPAAGRPARKKPAAGRPARKKPAAPLPTDKRGQIDVPDPSSTKKPATD
jgi:hypothetical protein